MSGKPPSRLGSLAFELIIIIAGILIALAVDQWNDGRRDRQLETMYLRALTADLRDDSIGYADYFMPALARKDSALNAIAPVIRGGPVPADTLQFLNGISLAGLLGSTSPMTVARRTTFDELTATGNLSLIRDASLRATLVDHYNRVQIEVARLRSRVPDYPMAVHAFYPAELRDAARPEIVRAFGLRRAVAGFRSPEFEAVMNREFNFMYLAQDVMQDLFDRTNQVLLLVREAQ